MLEQIKKLNISLKVGFFLAVREIKRANIWATLLITLVMTLTFLNLIVIRGILVGLTQGSIVAYKERYTGDVFIRTLDQKQYIEDTHLIQGILNTLPSVSSFSMRYVANGKAEADYKKLTVPDEDEDSINAVVAGIDPVAENTTTGLASRVIKGRFFQEGSRDEIIVGASLLEKYTSTSGVGMSVLKNADVGSKIRLTINNVSREVTIIGVTKAKVQAIDSRIIMIDQQLRPMINRNDFNVNEIAIKTTLPQEDKFVKSVMIGNNIDSLGIVQTWEEAQPQFVKDITSTFRLLGDVIGSIGLAVASITIFIVIFVNAITRRKYIGILKGIGIDGFAIESSYIFQSLFYAVCGTLIGLAIVYGLIVPYFANNPIDFPFSDGIFIADVQGVFIRVGLLLVTTIIAGYIPARIVVKQNTLDAILGR